MPTCGRTDCPLMTGPCLIAYGLHAAELGVLTGGWVNLGVAQTSMTMRCGRFLPSCGLRQRRSSLLLKVSIGLCESSIPYFKIAWHMLVVVLAVTRHTAIYSAWNRLPTSILWRVRCYSIAWTKATGKHFLLDGHNLKYRPISLPTLFGLSQIINC